MDARLDEKFSHGGAAGSPGEGSVAEVLEGIRHDLNSVIGALELLQIKRCSECKQFFNSAEPGALFDYGKLVCYSCVPGWWSSLSSQISVAERERIETGLSSWLRKYHGAEVAREGREKSAQSAQAGFQIVVHCIECGGSGKLLEGERCRFCKGLGTVWIVTSE